MAHGAMVTSVDGGRVLANISAKEASVQYCEMKQAAKCTARNLALLLVLSGVFRNDFAAAAQFAVYFPLAGETSGRVKTVAAAVPPSSDLIAAQHFAPWQEYCDAWRRHHAEPANQAVQKQLGISSGQGAVSVSSGRSTAVAMRLPLTDMRRVETEHFILLSDAGVDRCSEVLHDLERFYLIWTQLFFPLWKDQERWDRAAVSNQPPATLKHRVILFANSARYADVLRDVAPAIARSSGFYSDLKRITFFHDGNRDDSATRYHEITHQLMSEATYAKPRLRPGEHRDFWLVEGIACYMESAIFHEDHATVGGWESARLQYARQRVLGLDDQLTMDLLAGEGRAAVQQRQDLSRWYSFAAAYTHQLAEQHEGSGWISVLQRLARVYQVKTPFFAVDRESPLPRESLAQFLQLSDQQISPVFHDRLQELCLTRTQLTGRGLEKISPQRALKWLDCSFLPVGTAEVIRLSPHSATIEQLSLEATAIDNSIGQWLSGASVLRELDLSSCAIGDRVIATLPRSAPIQTLWLTASGVSDASIDTIAGFTTLQRVDVQKSAVTDAGLARLRALRSDLQINPLEIASP